MRARGGIRPLAGMMGAGFVGVVLVMALVSDGGRPALHGATARARALARALSLILLHSQRAGSVHRASVLRACMLLSSSTLVMHAKILEPGRSKKMLSLPSHLTRNGRALPSPGPARTVLVLHGGDNPLPVHVGNWRTDNKAKWCGDDPDCDFGNVAKDKEKAHILKSTRYSNFLF